MLLPEKMDFIEQSNSQTVRLYYKKKSYKNKAGMVLHLFSIHINPEVLEEFEKNGHMFGVKLGFNKHMLGIKRSSEYFQSLDFHKKGCLDNKGNWCPDSVFYRSSLSFGRIKIYLFKRVIKIAFLIKDSGRRDP